MSLTFIIFLFGELDNGGIDLACLSRLSAPEGFPLGQAAAHQVAERVHSEGNLNVFG